MAYGKISLFSFFLLSTINELDHPIPYSDAGTQQESRPLIIQLNNYVGTRSSLARFLLLKIVVLFICYPLSNMYVTLKYILAWVHSPPVNSASDDLR